MNIIPVGFYLGRCERKNLFFLVWEGMYFIFLIFFFRGGRLFLLTAILQLDYVYGEGCCNKSIFWNHKNEF